MRRLMLAASLLALTVAPARADPVSLGAAAVGIASWWASLGIVTQAVILVGVGLALAGVSYLIGGAGHRQADAQTDRLASVNVPERDGLLERCRLYGIATTPGGVFFQQTVADGSPNLNVYVLGVTLSEGVCESLEAIVINGVECELDSQLVPQTYPWRDGANIYFELSFRQGTTSQAIDPLIASYFPSEDTEYRQRGVATAVIAMQFGADADQHTLLWGASGVPQILFKVKGLRVYDPREALQDPDDPTTWAWSDNATLIEADWMTCAMGFAIPSGEMDWTQIALSATLDDQQQVTLSGSEARGRINGRAFSAQPNDDVLRSMGQQNRALFRRADGLQAILADEASESVATIWDDLLVGDINYQNEPDMRAALNTVHAEFRPASKFNQSDEITFQDADSLALDGQDYDQRIYLPYCDSPAAAQRLSYALIKENRAGRSLSLVLDIECLYAPGKANKTLQVGDVVLAEFAYYPAINGLYKILNMEITADFTVALNLAGYDPATISGWTLALESEFS